MASWLFIVSAATAPMNTGINWTQTLVTAGLGGVLALMGTGLTLWATDRRERRSYARSRQETRIQMHRIEYLATLQTLDASQNAGMALASKGAVSTLGALRLDELTNTRLRLMLLPAPTEILDLLGNITTQLIALHVNSGGDIGEQIKVIAISTTDLAIAMRKHLASMEQVKVPD